MIDAPIRQETAVQGSWFVRAVALLLVAAGLHAGSFRDLDDVQDRYFGTPDHSAAVLLEPRKALAPRAQADSPQTKEPALGAHDAPSALALRAWSPAAALSRRSRHAPLAAPDVVLPQRLLPDPTGPPRA